MRNALSNVIRNYFLRNNCPRCNSHETVLKGEHRVSHHRHDQAD
jgi:translation initiation factor 2 beta subunit (eIF-2beta)/eIF-5